jgi:hypothetical protein
MTLRSVINADVTTIMAGGFTVTATHSYGESSESLAVLWDDTYSTDSMANMEYEQSEAAILVATADTGNISHTSQITIDSVTYYVRQIETDRDGMTRITLQEVAR